MCQGLVETGDSGGSAHVVRDPAEEVWVDKVLDNIGPGLDRRASSRDSNDASSAGGDAQSTPEVIACVFGCPLQV